MKSEGRLSPTEREKDSEKLRIDLTYAMFKKDVLGIKARLLMVAEQGFELELGDEVHSAAFLLDRIEEDSINSYKVKPLSKYSLGEVKAGGKPPVDVLKVLSAATILLGHDFKTWKEVYKCVRAGGDNSFLKQTQRLDLRKVPVDTAVRSQQMMGTLDIDNIQKKSLAASDIARWVKDGTQTVINNAT